MEEMMVEVRRNLFFSGVKQGYLRYSEISPPKEECDHQVCNCTKAVQDRPAGEPEQQNQHIQFVEKGKDYTYEVNLVSTGCQFVLRWPGVVWDKEHKWFSKNHAYYWFNSNGVDNMIQIEIIKEGYGKTNCFFAHVYLGDIIDTSRFFNGHSNSRIVDLTKLKSDEVWAHQCGFGSEAQCSFRECHETQEWRRIYAIQQKIAATARTYTEDFVSSVEKVRLGIESESHMIDDVRHLCRWFSWVTINLEKTEMFRCGDYCYTNS
jgi:hypothetical protein